METVDMGLGGPDASVGESDAVEFGMAATLGLLTGTERSSFMEGP